MGLFRRRPRWQDFWTIEIYEHVLTEHDNWTLEIHKRTLMEGERPDGRTVAYGWDIAWTNWRAIMDMNVTRQTLRGAGLPPKLSMPSTDPNFSERLLYGSRAEPAPIWYATDRAVHSAGEQAAALLWHREGYDR